MACWEANDGENEPIQRSESIQKIGRSARMATITVKFIDRRERYYPESTAVQDFLSSEVIAVVPRWKTGKTG
ncbi:hypothetical protein C8R21_101176 [Nitrosospira multiformis]|jgi:hypothetical protein|uniref:Uncharacterized protein n=1 Tax=Nitrosospira multiformis TaxID=1231 RepID=A0A2T5II31_9PROT|nr:hypothetical protein C8R21_101176 [Nitrosospira multiformis]